MTRFKLIRLCFTITRTERRRIGTGRRRCEERTSPLDAWRSVHDPIAPVAGRIRPIATGQLQDFVQGLIIRWRGRRHRRHQHFILFLLVFGLLFGRLVLARAAHAQLERIHRRIPTHYPGRLSFSPLSDCFLLAILLLSIKSPPPPQTTRPPFSK